MLQIQNLDILGVKTVMTPTSAQHTPLPSKPHGSRWFFKEHNTTTPNFNSYRHPADTKINQAPSKNNNWTAGFDSSTTTLTEVKAKESAIAQVFNPPPTYSLVRPSAFV
jgi:hypothetical protein